jgi:hypothetical protein
VGTGMHSEAVVVDELGWIEESPRGRAPVGLRLSQGGAQLSTVDDAEKNVPRRLSWLGLSSVDYPAGLSKAAVGGAERLLCTGRLLFVWGADLDLQALLFE